VLRDPLGAAPGGRKASLEIEEVLNPRRVGLRWFGSRGCVGLVRDWVGLRWFGSRLVGLRWFGSRVGLR
jgi:hypothetical protein